MAWVPATERPREGRCDDSGAHAGRCRLRWRALVTTRPLPTTRQRLQDGCRQDARRPERLVERRSDHLRRRHAAGRLPVRGDPGRDLDRGTSTETGPRRPRQPRAVARSVPGDPAGPDRTRPSAELRLNQHSGRRAQGRLRHPAERRATSASARTSSSATSTASTATCSSRTRRLATSSSARRSTWHQPAASADRAGRRAGGRRRRVRREERRVQVDLRHGPPQPREQPSAPGLRQAGRALGRRHVRRAGVAALPVQRRQRRRRLERPGALYAFSRTPAGDQRLRRPDRRRRRSPARSSRCHRRSRPARRTAAR